MQVSLIFLFYANPDIQNDKRVCGTCSQQAILLPLVDKMELQYHGNLRDSFSHNFLFMVCFSVPCKLSTLGSNIQVIIHADI